MTVASCGKVGVSGCILLNMSYASLGNLPLLLVYLVLCFEVQSSSAFTTWHGWQAADLFPCSLLF